VRAKFRGCVPKFTPSFQSAVTSIAIASDTNYQTDIVFLLLRSCPNLVDISLDSSSTQLRPSILPHPIFLPHLTHLRTSLSSGLEVVSALRLFSLEYLHLSRVSWTTAAVEFLTRVFQTCPSLSRILLLSNPRSPAEILDNFTPDASVAPIVLDNVTEFHISGAPIIYPLLRQLALPRVQVLELEHLPFDVAYNFTSSPAHLTSLSLRHIGDPFRTFRYLTFPALTSLELFNAPNFLDCIHSPQLNYLALRCDTYDRPSLGSLRHFTERSEPIMLHTLRLKGVEIADGDLIWCLERFPHLRDLALVECSVSDVVLRALETPSMEKSSGWLLPHLTVIEFKDNDDMTPRGVIEFLKSRNGLSPWFHAAPAVPRRVEGRLSFLVDESYSEYKKIQSLGDFMLPYHPGVYKQLHSPVRSFLFFFIFFFIFFFFIFSLFPHPLLPLT